MEYKKIILSCPQGEKNVDWGENEYGKLGVTKNGFIIGDKL